MRHLLFHITPQSSQPARDCVNWHLRQLEKYAGVFDGQWMFAVATGPGMVPSDEVIKLLPPKAQVILVPNQEQIRETYTLPLLLARGFTLNPADTVFYAHTKGLGWLGTPQENATRWWSLAMYRYLLSESGLPMLETAPFVGWMKVEGQFQSFPTHSLWHYPGTFWWFRAAAIYSRAWWLVVPTRYGAEAYPSCILTTQGAASLLRPTREQLFLPNGLNRLYTEDYWREIGIPTGPDADSYGIHAPVA